MSKAKGKAKNGPPVSTGSPTQSSSPVWTTKLSEGRYDGTITFQISLRLNLPQGEKVDEVGVEIVKTSLRRRFAELEQDVVITALSEVIHHNRNL